MKSSHDMQQTKCLPQIRASQRITMDQLATVSMLSCSDSIADAARKLAMSPSTFSRNLHEAEQALGCSLLNRSQRQCELSPAAKKFLPYAQQLLQIHKDTNLFMANWRSSRQGLMNLASTTSIMSVMLPILTQKLRSEFGFASLSLQIAQSQDIMERLLNGRASMGLVSEFENNPGFRTTPVLTAQLGLLAASDCSLPSRIDSFDDLANVPFIRMSDQSSINRALQRAGIFFENYFKAPIMVDCVATAIDLAKREGLVMLTSGIAASQVQSLGMRFIPLPDLLPAVVTYVVSRKNVQFDDTQEIMRDMLCTSAREAPWHPSVQIVGRYAHT